MTGNKLSRSLLNIKDFIIESAEDTAERGFPAIVVTGHLHHGRGHRCPVCGKKLPIYDTQPIRRWRCLDSSTKMVYIRASLVRVNCPEHGIHVEAVPWARPGSRFTRDFEETVFALSKQMSFKGVLEKMRISWSSVERIVRRLSEEYLPSKSEQYDGLETIAVDETSYRKGHTYLTLVVNHKTGSVVWAGTGHDKATFSSFFQELSEEQRASIQIVSGDGAKWIRSVMNEYIPWSTFCLDRFHCTQWYLEALDIVRRTLWRSELNTKKALPKRGRGRPFREESEKRKKAANPKVFKEAKYPLGKNPENLTERQKANLAEIQVLAPKLFKGYQLKEQLRAVFDYPLEQAKKALEDWLSWACRCRIPEFVALSRKIRRNKEGILATIEHRISNARIEAVNNKIKCLIRRCYGFRKVENLIAMVKLCTSNVHIDYPGRYRYVGEVRKPLLQK